MDFIVCFKYYYHWLSDDDSHTVETGGSPDGIKIKP